MPKVRFNSEQFLIISLIRHWLVNQRDKKSEQMAHKPHVQSPLHWLFHGIHQIKQAEHNAQRANDDG